MKFLIGLGNPGSEYVDTPHNIGFQAVDVLAERMQETFSQQLRFRALVAKAIRPGENVMLVKPATFMNRSGSTVSLLLQFFKGNESDVLVIVDDVNLPLVQLRVRERGRSGGHNGLESVIAALGTDAFPRIRVGVGEARGGKDLVTHVLSPFRGDALEKFREATVTAADAAMCCLDEGVTVAMNTYNGRKTEG